jgi:hypothetical protein
MAGESIQDAAGRLGSRITDTAGNALDTVRQGLGSILGSISGGVSDAQEAVQPEN